MATEPATEHILEGPAPWEEEGDREHVHGVGPWRLALRRLRRNKSALAFGFVFILMVATCLAAPIWADKVAKTTPTANNLTGTIVVDGKRVNVVSLDGTPIGPTWQGRYFLGADSNGRDVMVRLLYGGRNSLLIGVGAALLTTLLAVVVGVVAGYYRGWVDSGLTKALDIVWAFPVLLLGVALGVALGLGGLKAGADHHPWGLDRHPHARDRLHLRALHGAPSAGPGAVPP